MHSKAPESVIDNFILQKNRNLATKPDLLMSAVKKVIEILRQDYFETSYHDFLLQQIKQVLTKDDLRFARVDFLIQLMIQQKPSQFSGIIQEFLPQLIQTYQTSSSKHFIKTLIFQIEQLLDLAVAQQALNNAHLPYLQAITQLSILENDASELQYHHITKVLEALAVIKTPESLDMMLALTQHSSWNVRNLANQLLEQGLEGLL
ncbi:MAG TPA: hypothetical protein DCS93_15920 [Microscillaceae bacterium]|nr:hypothetical protein [Microscillaceae bacterium]